MPLLTEPKNLSEIKKINQQANDIFDFVEILI